MKPCLRSGWKKLPPSPCLKELATSHRTKKYYSVRFLCPEEVLAKSLQNGLGCDLQLGIK
jgi:hypothetical protein